MSASMKVLAAAALVTMATPALAQDTAPWDLRDRNAYVMDMQGKMWSTRVGDKGMSMMVRNARAVPRGTVFFTNNGKLYMASAGMFDRAGGFVAMAAATRRRTLPVARPGQPGGHPRPSASRRKSHDRKDLRPDRDHADEQPKRHQGGDFLDCGTDHGNTLV